MSVDSIEFCIMSVDTIKGFISCRLIVLRFCVISIETIKSF